MFFLLLAFHSRAQDTLLIHHLLQRIAAQQVTSEQGFSNGNFPSYISNRRYFTKRKKDDNIFFAALICYTLRKYYNQLQQADQPLADSILQRTANLYKHYQNKSGRLSYNFWRTDTSFVFPYTWLIRLLNTNPSLPDDMDDTALSLMAQDADSTRAAEAHNIMQNYLNKKNNAKTIEKKYRHQQAYSVWYGKHFPPVFDVCVLSNVLSFVQQYHLHWTAADSTALAVIVESIRSRDYINKPLYVSPYYGSTSLIIYHLARLMSYGAMPELDSLKMELFTAARQEIYLANDELEKVILATAMMKLGEDTSHFVIPINSETISNIEKSNIPFFTGNIPSCFSLFYKHLFTTENWLLFYHYCPAFNDVLLLEYLLLRQHGNN